MASSRPRPGVGFLLPGGARVPVGGVKVAFEYANALVARGWTARIAMPYLLDEALVLASRASAWRRVRRAASYLNRRRRREYLPGSWFRLDPRVDVRFVPTPEARYLPPADAWVATAWRTAPWVARTSGARLYLLQHLETWDGPEADVMSTWKLPLRKVVIARWLEDVARGLGERADYVPNGLDFEAFGLDVPPEVRPAARALMLFHGADWKGSADGIGALEAARREEPGLEAILFGVPARPAGLPGWIGYEQRPAQRRLRELYNAASLFLAPSWTEGWPLPPAEAMACGCALVATDIGGHREYARDGETALLARPRDPPALARQLLRALRDSALRISLARAGNAFIRRFTWERATDRMEAVLEEEIAARAAARAGRP